MNRTAANAMNSGASQCYPYTTRNKERHNLLAIPISRRIPGLHSFRAEDLSRSVDGENLAPSIHRDPKLVRKKNIAIPTLDFRR